MPWLCTPNRLQVLQEYGMYAELAALYKYNGCHGQGLDLLYRLSQEPETMQPPARGAAKGAWGMQLALESTAMDCLDTNVLRTLPILCQMYLRCAYRYMPLIDALKYQVCI